MNNYADRNGLWKRRPVSIQVPGTYLEGGID